MHANGVHERLIAKLGLRVDLGDDDRRAVRGLPITIRNHARHAQVAREGSRSVTCGFMISGYAFRSKTTTTGGRQIVALLLPGDLIDLQQIVLPRADHSVEALTPLQVGEIPCDRLQELALCHPAIGRAIWIDTLIDGSIMRELLLNNGRRDAIERIAHLFCEFAYRLSPSDMPVHDYELPVTQEQLGDMSGLTSVHVNRTLKMLAERGLVTRQGRSVVIADWNGLRHLGGFSSNYLHLDANLPTSSAERPHRIEPAPRELHVAG